MNGWEDVYDAQMDLLRFWRSDLGVRHSEAMAETVRSKGDVEPLAILYGNLHAWEERNLRHAEPVYMSKDALRLVNEAASTFEPETLHEFDLIVRAGFVMLPTVGPSFSDEIDIRAMSWGCESGSMVWVGYAAIEGPAPGYPGLIPVVGSTWPFGKTFEELMDLEGATGAGRDYAARWGAWTQSFFRIAQQRIVASERETGPRSQRRRAARAGLEEKQTIVMRLRRHESSASGECEVEWRQRWIVRGHWRNQFYPSLGTHRQKWIGGYVKGPEDKPLVVTDRAVEFVR